MKKRHKIEAFTVMLMGAAFTVGILVLDFKQKEIEKRDLWNRSCWEWMECADKMCWECLRENFEPILSCRDKEMEKIEGGE